MTTSYATISQHPLTISWRRQFLRDVIHGLARPQKALPCKYFYDATGSTLFDQICELPEYYLTRTELEILRTHAFEMAEAIGEDCDLIELGSGSGLKTRLLLAALRPPRAYLPIDISREHLENSVRDLAQSFPSLRFIPVHADFTAPFSLPDTGDPVARRVVYFPGSTIGNFSPRAALALLTQIADLVGPGGGLLIGFDLDKDESIVWPAYNDRQGNKRRFQLEPPRAHQSRARRRLRSLRFRAPGRLPACRTANDHAPLEQEKPGRSSGRPPVCLPRGRGHSHRRFLQILTRALLSAHFASRLHARPAMARPELLFFSPVFDGRLISSRAPLERGIAQPGRTLPVQRAQAPPPGSPPPSRS